VSDTGIGIRKEDIGKLFSAYNQIDIKSNRFIEGTGLGLSICKQLTEMMDGTITAESEYGKGSVFTVRFCQKIADDAPIGKAVAGSLENFRFAAAHRERNKNIVRVQMPYARVLVVDDVNANLDVAKGMMMAYGLTIDCAASGRQAIALIREEKVRYNAIFMDHMMPEMDGIEAVRIIREEIDTQYARTIPIIALTANAIIGNEEMFLKHGFQDFLSKPIDIMRLDAVLNKWVRDRRYEKKFFEETEKASPGPDSPPEYSGPLNQAVPGSPSTPEASPDPAAAGPAPKGILTRRIEGIDLAAGLARFANREQVYLRVLSSYVSNMPILLDKIRDCSEELLPDYIITVHGIKGASYGISADGVGKQAEELEMAAKRGDLDTIRVRNAPFITTAETLVSELSGLLDERTSLP
jgi:CheY-like chemotaxis protein